MLWTAVNPINALQRWAIIAMAVIILGGGFGAWERYQGHKAGEADGNARVAALTAQYAAASAKAASDALAKEQASAATMATIDARHAQELSDAKHDADNVISGLKSGNLRLRDEWTACRATASVPTPGASVGSADAAAELRAALAAAIVQVGADADADTRARQAVIRADRQ